MPRNDHHALPAAMFMPWGRVGLRAVLAMVAAGAFCGFAYPEERVPEYQAKAAFLINFARFVQWPECSAADCAAVRVCVFGPSPFGTTLDDLAAATTVNGKKVVVRNILDARHLQGCQVAFVAGSEGNPRDELFQASQDLSVLLVGERKGFAERGGSVNFFLENGRLQFEINPLAAARAHLQISSKLLQLARICAK